MTNTEKLPLEQGFKAAVEIYWSRLLKFAKVVAIVIAVMAPIFVFVFYRYNLIDVFTRWSFYSVEAALITVFYVWYQKRLIEMRLSLANFTIDEEIRKQLAVVGSNDPEIGPIVTDIRVEVHSRVSSHGLGLFFSEAIRVEFQKQLFYRDMPLTDSIITRVMVQKRGQLDSQDVNKIADVETLIGAARDTLRFGA